METLHLLDGHIDIYLPDYKYYSSYYAGLYSHAEDYREFAVPAIDEMVRQTGAPQFDKKWSAEARHRHPAFDAAQTGR